MEFASKELVVSFEPVNGGVGEVSLALPLASCFAGVDGQCPL